MFILMAHVNVQAIANDQERARTNSYLSKNNFYAQQIPTFDNDVESNKDYLLLLECL